MKVYIVRGATGEYSDYTEWAAKAFTEELKAKDYMTVLNEKLTELGINIEKDLPHLIKFKWKPEPYLQDKSILTLDPNFQLDYTGTEYFIETIEVEE